MHFSIGKIFLLIPIIFLLFSKYSIAQVDELSKKISGLSPISDSLAFILSHFPSDDLPSEWNDCRLSATEYYYGIDTRINYEKARCAAFREFSKGSNNEWNGSGILSMIYANGYGVDRNLDLAIMVESLTEHAYEYEIDRDYDYEIDRFCGGTRNYHFRNCVRTRRYPVLFARKVRLDNLIGAHEDLRYLIDEFTSARQTNETHQWGGTVNSYMYPDWHEEDFQDMFHVMAIEFFNSGQFPNYTEKEFRLMDEKLNHIYNHLRGNAKGISGFLYGGECCSFEKIQETQRLWLDYRDTWVEFGQRWYPKVDSWSWLSWLTLWRIWQLESLGNPPDGVITEIEELGRFSIDDTKLKEQFLLSLTYEGYIN